MNIHHDIAYNFIMLCNVILLGKLPIGVQKPGPQYSPAIVVYTLHSIVMVLLYYITS